MVLHHCDGVLQHRLVVPRMVQGLGDLEQGEHSLIRDKDLTDLINDQYDVHWGIRERFQECSLALQVCFGSLAITDVVENSIGVGSTVVSMGRNGAIVKPNQSPLFEAIRYCSSKRSCEIETVYALRTRSRSSGWMRECKSQGAA
jgi:hypothetical protein